ncbi:Fe-S cluster assembly iron-binding protein IscA [Paenibacillus shirakamiensis]|uniref:Fe-S cluster assembly iron-binding protein IscA n=1 Tax=Paenibacillus shirakamiensis TaxID=1265935 RepID=A0ABS4JHY4_9BACL|nr:iron-sulfur cluster assembly accessory protein [Paenibacillus shirakamiensis]MBP2001333.1 Fe-S cluster assembly iron-binding protein IscA [Paenibacillus shirakamiensis]
MSVKITRNAAKIIKLELEKEEHQGKGLLLKVFITHAHGDHAHYGMDLAKPEEKDQIVSTDKEIDVIIDPNEPLLDGVKIDYLYFPEEGFVITNPSKGNHGDH